MLTNVTKDTYATEERKRMFEALNQKLIKLPDCLDCRVGVSDFLRFVIDHPYFNTTALIYCFLETS